MFHRELRFTENYVSQGSFLRNTEKCQEILHFLFLVDLFLVNESCFVTEFSMEKSISTKDFIIIILPGDFNQSPKELTKLQQRIE